MVIIIANIVEPQPPLDPVPLLLLGLPVSPDLLAISNRAWSLESILLSWLKSRIVTPSPDELLFIFTH